ncbi:MAG: YceI family protein [Arenicellales bacterium]|nr:YceI family protein [Arenicellales bacterium]
MTRSFANLCKAFIFTVLFVLTTGAARADEYMFDKLHTQILFFVDHFGFSKSEGEFLDFEGTFTFDKRNFEKSEVELTIFTDSIDMDDEKWNEKMKGKRYFNTTKYPTIQFTSTSVETVDERNAAIHGNLTLLDTTLPVTVYMRFNKAGVNLASGLRTAGFSGHARLRRSDFGMKSHLKYIGDEVEIRLEVEGFIEKKRKNDL